MNKAKRLLVIALAAALLCGCDGLMGIKERTLPPGAPSSPAPVLPRDGDVAPSRVPVTLYYRYIDSEYLAPYCDMLDITSDKPIEQIVLERLIQGPGEESSEYAALISPDTKVRSVRVANDYLEITLSADYVEHLTSISGGPWEANTTAYEQELTRRKRLALLSIVNTITELGTHARVMVMIDQQQGIAAKLRREQAGIESPDDRDGAIDPMGRDEEAILTVRRCAGIALDAIIEKRWDRLEPMIASQDVDGEKPPYIGDIADSLSARPSLIGYTLSQEETVMPYSAHSEFQQAVIGVSATFSDALGATPSTRENIPLRLIRVDGIWRVAYPSLDAMVPYP